MRLGDLDALKAQFDNIPPFFGLTGGCVKEIIDKTPTIDAVPVVRCKECKSATVRRYEFNGEVYSVFCNRLFEKMKEDDFCSRGMRKDGDG